MKIPGRVEEGPGRIADEPGGMGEEPGGSGAIAGESGEIARWNLPPQSQIGERPVGEREPPGKSFLSPPSANQAGNSISGCAPLYRIASANLFFPVSQEEYERCQGSVSRLHAERDKAVSDVEKVREELERCQSTLGKLQLQQEKTQQGYDKAQNEVDRLQERLDKTLAESRKVNRSALSSFYRFLSDNFLFFFLLLLLLFVGVVAAYRFGSLLRLSHWWYWSHVQFQSEKEKYVYDFDNMQAQLDKSAGQLSRVQKEKENIQQEMERFRDKHDKNQARKKQPPRASGNQSLRILIFCFVSISRWRCACRRRETQWLRKSRRSERNWNWSNLRSPRRRETVNFYSAKPSPVANVSTKSIRVLSKCRSVLLLYFHINSPFGCCISIVAQRLQVSLWRNISILFLSYQNLIPRRFNLRETPTRSFYSAVLSIIYLVGFPFDLFTRSKDP